MSVPMITFPPFSLLQIRCLKGYSRVEKEVFYFFSGNSKLKNSFCKALKIFFLILLVKVMKSKMSKPKIHLEIRNLIYTTTVT